LVEIIANLKDRVQDAKLNGWLGEVAGLQTSLNEAVRKLVSLDLTKIRASGPVDPGIPVITTGPVCGRPPHGHEPEPRRP